MNKPITWIALMLSMFVTHWAGTAAHGERPEWGRRVAVDRRPAYVILRAPARAPRGHAHHSGRGYAVRAHGYAYGWFGARPRRHWRRATGYNESYIEWSSK